MDEKYVVIGFNEEYQRAGDEPYYAELRFENEQGTSLVLAYRKSEEEIRKVAKVAAANMEIRFDEDLMI